MIHFQGHSQGCWPEASVTCHLDLSTGLLIMPLASAKSESQLRMNEGGRAREREREREREWLQCLLRPDLGRDTVSLLPPSISHTDQSWYCVGGYECQEVWLTGATLEVGYHTKLHPPAPAASALGLWDRTGGGSLWGGVARFSKLKYRIPS